MPLEDVYEALQVDPKQGLSDEEVRSRVSQFGENTIPRVRGPFWKVYIAPILNWLITIYIISSFALIIIAQLLPPSDQNEMGQAMVWLGVVAVNALVAIVQQFRAQKKLEALEQLSAGEARIIRNGSEMSIPPMKAVPGDIVILEQGDRIPVDARIINCSNLTTDEASMTGESVPAIKDDGSIVAEDAPITDMRNMVFFGSYVSTGMATIVTTATGGIKVSRNCCYIPHGSFTLLASLSLAISRRATNRIGFRTHS
jgi:Ca2+-transporting ATPase